MQQGREKISIDYTFNRRPIIQKKVLRKQITESKIGQWKLVLVCDFIAQWLKLRKQVISWFIFGRRITLLTVGKSDTWCRHYGNKHEVFHIRNRYTVWSSFLLPRHISKVCVSYFRDLTGPTSIAAVFTIVKKQKLTGMYISQWMENENVVFIYYGIILFGSSNRNHQ